MCHGMRVRTAFRDAVMSNQTELGFTSQRRLTPPQEM